VLEVGARRYDLDVMGFVTALEPVVSQENGSTGVAPPGPGTERQAPTVVQVEKWSSLGQGWTAVLSRRARLLGGTLIQFEGAYATPLPTWGSGFSHSDADWRRPSVNPLPAA